MIGKSRTSAVGCILLCGIWAHRAAHAQSRSEVIEAARIEKEASLTPQSPSKAERKFAWAENSLAYRLLNGQVSGFGVGFGQIAVGTGFAIGPQYRRSDLLGGMLTLRVGARATS